MVPPLHVSALIAMALSGVAVAADLPPPATRPVDFIKDIKPLFEAACIKCHAKGKEKGGFSLETRESFLKGGETDAAATPGDSAEAIWSSWSPVMTQRQ